MSCKILPTAIALTALVLMLSHTPGTAQELLEVVECHIVDAPVQNPVLRGDHPGNNGNGVAEPGEWVGFWFLLHIPRLPEQPWVRVVFDESFPHYSGSTRRVQPQVVDAAKALYTLDLSEEGYFHRRSVHLVKGKTTATFRLELMSSLTILGHTTYAIPVTAVDLVPPTVWMVERQPAGQVDLGESVHFTVYLGEDQTVTRVQGRLLQLPERREAAQVRFAVDEERTAQLTAGSWMFQGSWTVDHSGDFLLEITAEDDSGNRVTVSSFSVGTRECLITTQEFTPAASILYYGRRTASVFHDDVYLEILRRNGIPFDLWDTDLRGANGAIWLDYSGPDQAVVLLPSNMDVRTYDDIANFARAGGNLLIPASMGVYMDTVFYFDQPAADLMRDYLFSTLAPYSAASARQSASVHDTEEYPLFKGLDLIVDQGLSSAILPSAGVGIGIADPLLVDAAGGVQAVCVQDRGVTIYLNFPLATVADQRMREELYLRSLEDLLGVELPRAPITAVLETPQPPTAFALDQNYPNPFNAATLIRYRLAQAGPVQLTLYDIVGQEVARLVDEAQPAGQHQVRWEGDGQASGAFFYRLEAGLCTETRRMLLLK